MQRRTVLSGHEADESHLSYDLWKDAPLEDALLDPSVGALLHEDFMCFGGPVATNVGSKAGRSGMWKSYEDTGVSLDQLAIDGGVLGYIGTTTDNYEASIQAGYATGMPFRLVAGKKLWFETRIVKEVITDTLGFLVGLASANAPQNSLIADAGNDIADISFLGFMSQDVAGEQVEFCHQKAGNPLQLKQVDSTPIVTDLAAAVGRNYGFYYDGRGKLTPWVDREPQKSFMISGSALAATTFPGGVQMNVLFGVKQGTNVAQYVRCTGVTCLMV